MQDFHLIQAKNALPFLRLLEARRAPVDELATQTGLPLQAAREQNDGVVGEYALWQFIELGAASVGYDCLGYDCAQTESIKSAEPLGKPQLRLASSLRKTLEYFFEDVMTISTASYYTLSRADNSYWFRRAQAFGAERASWQAEQYTLAMLLHIIRLHGGTHWLPERIRVSSRPGPVELPIEWANIRFEWGCDATGIELSGEILDQPPIVTPDKPSRIRLSRAPRPTFEQLVATQISAGCPGIENASKQTGLSVSTLQRRLKNRGTSYRETLELQRYQRARHMLTETTLAVAEIGTDLGYGHLANFSRSFKRRCGISPLAYRAQKSILGSFGLPVEPDV